MKLTEVRQLMQLLEEEVTVFKRRGQIVIRQKVSSRHRWTADSLFDRLRRKGFVGDSAVVDGPGVYHQLYAEFVVKNEVPPRLRKVGEFWLKDES